MHPRRSAGSSLWGCEEYWIVLEDKLPVPASALTVPPVMSDDREMSVSDSHPITFNRHLGQTSEDEGQIAKIKVWNVVGGEHVGGAGKREHRSGRGVRLNGTLLAPGGLYINI